jgi:hypothetical protein
MTSFISIADIAPEELELVPITGLRELIRADQGWSPRGGQHEVVAELRIAAKTSLAVAEGLIHEWTARQGSPTRA